MEEMSGSGMMSITSRTLNVHYMKNVIDSCHRGSEAHFEYDAQRCLGAREINGDHTGY